MSETNEYSCILTRDEKGGYFAEHPDLPGCFAQGQTREEALVNLNDAREAWIEVRTEEGLEIPEPSSYSGRITIRTSPQLHESLANHAKVQGVSLNQLLNHSLAFYLGSASAPALQPREAPSQAPLRSLSERKTTTVVHSAAYTFRSGNHALARSLLQLLDSPAIENFLLALFFLQHSSLDFEQAISYLTHAFEDGLTFQEATATYKLLPQAMSPSRLKRILFEPALARNEEDLPPALCSFISWIEELQDNRERSSNWRGKANLRIVA